MCGRYSNHYRWADVHAFSTGLELSTPAQDPEPAYNFAPTQIGWVLTANDEGGGSAHAMRWGIIPAWARDTRIAWNTINARIETVASKPAFRAAWRARRCLVPASGYYEWPGEGRAKQPFYIHPARAPILMFAGLWERFTPADAEPVETYSIITMDAAGPLAELHDRMPLMLPAELHQAWLYGSADEAMNIAHAAPVPEVRWHAVGKAVGNVRNQGPTLIEPISTPTR